MRPTGRGASGTPLLAPIGGDGEVGENPTGEEESELEAEVAGRMMVARRMSSS